ncbi:hypothetical protein [Haladaptatus caseinilyticus]|uniref:hypothetical protein n=1 Tax=Haladaptatus caseinilyticus TaxID=2993314 RepID=UPI00224A911F|nr:hypothetical protein [Haladaptatus caseinilyticus]
MSGPLLIKNSVVLAIIFSIGFSVLFVFVNGLLFHPPQAEVLLTSIGAGIAVGVMNELVQRDEQIA